MEELIAAGVEAELRTSYSTCKWGMFMPMHFFLTTSSDLHLIIEPFVVKKKVIVISHIQKLATF